MQVIHIKLVILLLLSTFISNAQEIEKYDIYLIFNKNNGTHHQALGKKFINKNGLNFNLYRYYFLNKKDFKKDTFDLKELPCLRVIEESDIDLLEKEFREKNHSILMKKYPGGYPPYDRNFIFNTFIVEKLIDSIVIYEVIFRNEGIQK